MTYKREYKRTRRKLRETIKIWPNDVPEFMDLSRHPAVVCMAMRLRGYDQSPFFTGLYDAWHNVLRALENLHRHTSTK